MNHVELHVHHLRQLVQDNVVNLDYHKTNDQITNIFMKTLLEDKFVKIQAMLRLQEVAIMWGCSQEVI